MRPPAGVAGGGHQPADRRLLRGRWPRGEEGRVAGPLGRGAAAMTSAAAAGRGCRDRPAPEGDVDGDLPLGGPLLRLQRMDGRRRRDRVERHVHDRGDAARRRPGRAREALPLGAPGLVDVHVAVDQSRQQHLVVGEGDRAGGGVVEAGARGDPAVRGVHRGRTLAVGEQHPAGADHERHAVSCPRSVRAVSAPVTRCSWAPRAVAVHPPGHGSRTASSPVATGCWGGRVPAGRCTVDAHARGAAGGNQAGAPGPSADPDGNGVGEP
ncbi:hypothetical protein SAMN05660350_04342 [Geodermatophilus obscurus]|uniref:Uncharacterized protein n=1 Tax=Geodermatophilus obscurus TaxID=1861 RepID=A0A1M7UYR0_9ACTN|nr:hypothetical protein SAMN05660350_04342 [Geodermatophilus obscurus]